MKDAVLIFLGGGVGSILRWSLSLFLTTKSAFPIATFAANLIACAILGAALAYVASQSSPSWFRPLLVVGLCGGFSTFSTFSAENVALLKAGNYSMFAVYVGVSLLLCIGGILLGHSAVTFISK